MGKIQLIAFAFLALVASLAAQTPQRNVTANPSTGALIWPVNVTGGVTISGTGTLEKSGTATLTLDGNNGGTIRIGGIPTQPAAQFRRLYNQYYNITAGSGGRINWVAAGDSLAVLTPTPIISYFKRCVGDGGLALQNLAAALAGGAATSAGNWTDWLTGDIFTVPAGGSVTFSYIGSDVSATTLKVFYIKNNYGAGVNTFKVQSQSAGGSWTDEATVDAHNATKTGGISTTTKSLAGYQVRVLGVTGTCRIIGAALLNNSSGSNGAVLWDVGKGGASMADEVTVTPAVLNAVMADITPTVVSTSFQDTPSIVSANLAAWNSMLTTSATAADFSYIGIPPVSDSSTDIDDLAQNASYRALCTTNNYFYLDTYGLLGSYANASAAGWAPDVHLSGAAHAYLSSAMLGQIGLVRSLSEAFGIVTQTSNALVLGGKSSYQNFNLLWSKATNSTFSFGVVDAAGTTSYLQWYAANHAYLPGAIGWAQSGREFGLNGSGLSLYSGSTKVFGVDMAGALTATSVSGTGSVVGGLKTDTGTATTTFTVTIGVTMANANYKVVTEGNNALSAAIHYVTNKTTTTFDVVYLAGLTGAVSFDWILTP